MIFKGNHRTNSSEEGTLATKGVFVGYSFRAFLSNFWMSLPVSITFPSMITTYLLVNFEVSSFVKASKFFVIKYLFIV